MNESSISLMTELDIPAVIEIQEECRLSPWSSEGYRAEIATRGSLCLVLRSDAETVAFAVARVNPAEALLEIYNIGVRKAFRRRHLGSALIDHLLRLSVEKGASMASLEVRRSNAAAIKFYERHGFHRAGYRKSFYSHPQEDALLMTMDLLRMEHM